MTGSSSDDTSDSLDEPNDQQLGRQLGTNAGQVVIGDDVDAPLPDDVREAFGA